MRWTSSKLSLFLISLAGLAGSACQSGGVGDPCIPEDEYFPTFSGYSETEVNVESKSFQCETRVCLVANFKGRVSCPYGQAGDPTTGIVSSGLGPDQRCYLPGTAAADANEVTVPVNPQLFTRRPDSAVYCSCRCAGSDSNAKYCSCPSGFVCQNLVPTGLSKSSTELAGSYCIKDGTQVTDPNRIAANPCSEGPPANCGVPHPDGLN